MGSKVLALMVTLQLYKQNLESFLDRNSSEQPLHVKRHHDLVVVKFLTRDIEDENNAIFEFFTMSAKLPLRENEMSSRKADKLWGKTL